MVPLAQGYGTQTDALNGFFKQDIPIFPTLKEVGYNIIDFDDTYFRGGDVVQYFWYAQSDDGSRTSYPPGISDLQEPDNLSVSQIEQLTGGLLEVNFLPQIDWDPAYLERVALHPTGDIDPTPAELANSTQRSCILYVNKVNTARRSGSANRTSFMYTLDRLGYRGYYDVCDVQGFGNTNNDLGGRATQTQISGYGLIVQDVGRSALATIPNGSDWGTQKIDQAQEYANYLAQGGQGLAGSASLWVIGENWAFETTHAIPVGDLITKLGLSMNVVDAQSFGLNPLVEGKGAFPFAGGTVQTFADLSLRLAGGCPSPRTYDRLATTTGIVTHVYKDLTGIEEPAVVMNQSVSEKWNTVSMAFNWFDVHDLSGTAPNATRQELARRILNGVLPINCIRVANSTDVPPDEEAADLLPRTTALHQNTPNPFNPTTVIRFDLAQDGHVKLRVFDVAGRVLRTLVDEARKRQSHTVVWNGLDSGGHRVASGLYVYRLDTEGFSATRKLVVLR